MVVSSVSSREWESHVDQHGELFYVQFGSNLVPDLAKEVAGDAERQDEIKKKKKKGNSNNICVIVLSNIASK